jgi:hypothetical protein
MTTMMTTPDSPDTSAEQRRFGFLLLGIALALTILFVSFAVWTRQYWMMAFVVLVIPNVYMGIRSLHASRKK